MRRRLTQNNLPSSAWQKQIQIVNEFNNELTRGFSQNLSLYSPEQDLKLFQNINLKPISEENVNFDKINEKLNDVNVYNDTKQVINGIVDSVNQIGDATSNNIQSSLKNLFNLDTNSIYIYAGLFLFYLLILKKL